MQRQFHGSIVGLIVALSGALIAQACNEPGNSSSTGESSSTGGMTTGETTSTSGEESTTSTTGDVSTGEPGQSEPARVTLQVVNGDGQPIEGALVEFDGASHSTGVAGLLDLPVEIDELETRLVMRVFADGYTASAAVFDAVASGAEILHVVVLHALGEPVVLPADSGGVVERSGIRVELPPDAFVDSHGHPVQGNVEVTLVPLDPTLPGAMAQLPGPLAAVRADESAVELEPVMMAEISAWQGGQRLQLAPGKTAKMTFAVPALLQSTVGAGQSIPAWFFDNEQGIWREEGTGTIESKDGKLVWTVEVAHFTWWNADKPWILKNCYDVTVVDPEGNQVMNMKVTAEGLDYQGMTSKYTQANGHACVEGMLGGQVALKAGQAPNFLAEAQVQGIAEQPGACNGPGKCIPMTLMLPDADCYPGEQELCYTGPDKTEGVGICKPGAKTQLGDCTWSPCIGDVLPSAEKCAANNVDEDCDGDAHNGCLCTPGKIEPCWHSDPNTAMKQKQKIGLCTGGERTCADDGQSWGPCEGLYPPQGQPTPEEVLLCDNWDNDCDGFVDEGCPCAPNDPPNYGCYPGNPKDLDANGLCAEGWQQCVGGFWGPCEGYVKPAVEDCASLKDENCDGNSGCCGDEVVSPEEECDEGALNGVHACSTECTKRKVLQVVVGGYHACALLTGGKVKCWGDNTHGTLGLGDTQARGDEPGEMGAQLPDVQLGANVSVIALSAGWWHTCALLDSGGVKCWGWGAYGALGLGDSKSRGDGPNEMGDDLPEVDLGVKEPVVSLAAGYNGTCVAFSSGQLKCWGRNDYGQLGLGDTTHRGDAPGEMGEALPFVELGQGMDVVAVSAGVYHRCVVFSGGGVKCFGSGDELGLESTENRGDQPGEMGDALPLVKLGGDSTVQDLSVGSHHTCALLADNRVKCWGENWWGALGIGSTEEMGDNPGEMGDFLPSVDFGVGHSPVSVHGGGHASCAVLKGDGRVKCWGYNEYGHLGLGDVQSRGDLPDEMGDALPMVELGGPVSTLAQSAHGWFNCALLVDGSVKCWGDNPYGQLGLGDTQRRGDQPGEMGDKLPRVKLFSDKW